MDDGPCQIVCENHAPGNGHDKKVERHRLEGAEPQTDTRAEHLDVRESGFPEGDVLPVLIRHRSLLPLVLTAEFVNTIHTTRARAFAHKLST